MSGINLGGLQLGKSTKVAATGGGGVETIDTLVDLPGSPSDGDRVDLEVVSGEVASLRYDSGLGFWELGTPDSDPVTIWNGGDVFTESIAPSGGLTYSVDGSGLQVNTTSSASATKEQVYLEIAGVQMPIGCEVILYVDLGGSGIPSIGTYEIQNFLAQTGTNPSWWFVRVQVDNANINLEAGSSRDANGNNDYDPGDSVVVPSNTETYSLEASIFRGLGKTEGRVTGRGLRADGTESFSTGYGAVDPMDTHYAINVGFISDADIAATMNVTKIEVRA